MDMVLVENIVEFNKSPNAISFILKITNKTDKPIPDLSVTNRSKYVNFYINGVLDNPLSLYNGLEKFNDNEKVININCSEMFTTSWLITNDTGLIVKYGKHFTVQWEYMKKK